MYYSYEGTYIPNPRGGAREAFHQLRQAFTEAPILQYFNLEHHIRIKTDASDYTISGVLSQLTSDQVTLDFE